MSSGTIYIVGTPIGNLEDITLRALRILKETDLIAAEDTRHTQKLLNHYSITTPVTSYHEHNEQKKARQLVSDVIKGKNIAVVSNAGMPGISDPGFRIVKEAVNEQIRVEIIPGPTAIESALSLSGLPTDAFVFEGFLPQKSIGRKKKLFELLFETRTIVFFESPQRLNECLDDIIEILGDRYGAVAKELTKIHETILRGQVSDIRNLLHDDMLKGEFVIIVAGNKEGIKREKHDPDKLVSYILSKMNISRMEAIKLAASILELPKSFVYKKEVQK